MPLPEEFLHSDLVSRFLTSPSRDAVTIPFSLKRGASNERYMGSYVLTDSEWGVFVQAKEAQVYRPVKDMRSSARNWSLLALVLATVSAVIFAGRLSRPIERLAAASRALMAGEFTARVEVRGGNEIGELAETFNRMAANIEDHVRRLNLAALENKKLFEGTIRSIAEAIDAKDPYTKEHSKGVEKRAMLIARELGMSEAEVEEIGCAALLHDVGKLAIEDKILGKTAGLTPEEKAVIKTHPERGAKILSRVEGEKMKRIIPGVRNHHERWDGKGYPDGLVGEAIPLMARIITVADTFDAMTTDRPYQRAMTHHQALEQLNALKGIVLDKKVVEAFNRVYLSAIQGEERLAV
jgi:putative nucleotidyltransferase with HDIG domain